MPSSPRPGRGGSLAAGTASVKAKKSSQPPPCDAQPMSSRSWFGRLWAKPKRDAPLVREGASYSSLPSAAASSRPAQYTVMPPPPTSLATPPPSRPSRPPAPPPGFEVVHVAQPPPSLPLALPPAPPPGFDIVHEAQPPPSPPRPSGSPAALRSRGSPPGFEILHEASPPPPVPLSRNNSQALPTGAAPPGFEVLVESRPPPNAADASSSVAGWAGDLWKRLSSADETDAGLRRRQGGERDL